MLGNWGESWEGGERCWGRVLLLGPLPVGTACHIYHGQSMTTTTVSEMWLPLRSEIRSLTPASPRTVVPGRAPWGTNDPGGPSLSRAWVVPTIHSGTASGARCGLSRGCRKLSCRAEVSLPRCARVAGAALRPQQGGGKVLFPFMHPLVRVATG